MVQEKCIVKLPRTQYKSYFLLEVQLIDGGQTIFNTAKHYIYILENEIGLNEHPHKLCMKCFVV